ncbi:hypothetical protein FOA52_012616 [Chlamydomonas sp. UWO 241]|nr:hypothetical protein FOA52_012616 [Chlamydomonas sp. UWO 241]
MHEHVAARRGAAVLRGGLCCSDRICVSPELHDIAAAENAANHPCTDTGSGTDSGSGDDKTGSSSDSGPSGGGTQDQPQPQGQGGGLVTDILKNIYGPGDGGGD